MLHKQETGYRDRYGRPVRAGDTVKVVCVEGTFTGVATSDNSGGWFLSCNEQWSPYLDEFEVSELEVVSWNEK